MPKRLLAATLLLTFTLGSCRTWTPLDSLPDPVPDPVRVELVSGERLKVRGARIEAETLVGRRLDGVAIVRVPLDQIASVAAGRRSGTRTTLLVIGGGLGLLILVGYMDIERNGLGMGPGG